MKLVVDTNIIISSIISDKGKIGELLLNKPNGVTYFAPSFLKNEIINHTSKIIKITAYTENEFELIKALLMREIVFIKMEEIEKEKWNLASAYLKDIDPNDIPFLALNLQIDALLWTGDKKLIKGLETKGYRQLITTAVLYRKLLGA